MNKIFEWYSRALHQYLIILLEMSSQVLITKVGSVGNTLRFIIGIRHIKKVVIDTEQASAYR